MYPWPTSFERRTSLAATVVPITAIDATTPMARPSRRRIRKRIPDRPPRAASVLGPGRRTAHRGMLVGQTGSLSDRQALLATTVPRGYGTSSLALRPSGAPGDRALAAMRGAS